MPLERKERRKFLNWQLYVHFGIFTNNGISCHISSRRCRCSYNVLLFSHVWNYCHLSSEFFHFIFHFFTLIFPQPISLLRLSFQISRANIIIYLICVCANDANNRRASMRQIFSQPLRQERLRIFSRENATNILAHTHSRTRAAQTTSASQSIEDKLSSISILSNPLILFVFIFLFSLSILGISLCADHVDFERRFVEFIFTRNVFMRSSYSNSPAGDVFYLSLTFMLFVLDVVWFFFCLCVVHKKSLENTRMHGQIKRMKAFETLSGG